MGWIVIILLALILFAILGLGSQRRAHAGGRKVIQRERLRAMAIDAATSNSKQRQQWGRETLERLKREDDERARIVAEIERDAD